MVESREQYDRLNKVLDGDEGGKEGEPKQIFLRCNKCDGAAGNSVMRGYGDDGYDTED